MRGVIQNTVPTYMDATPRYGVPCRRQGWSWEAFKAKSLCTPIMGCSLMWTVQEIASALGAEAVGDTTLRISAAAEPAAAGQDDLALATNPKYADALSTGQAKGVRGADRSPYRARKHNLTPS